MISLRRTLRPWMRNSTNLLMMIALLCSVMLVMHYYINRDRESPVPDNSESLSSASRKEWKGCFGHSAESFNFTDGGRLMFAGESSECSPTKSVDSWSVCLAGPLKPRPGDCELVAVASEVAAGRSLSKALGCRLLVLPDSAEADRLLQRRNGRIDALLGGSGPALRALLSAGMRGTEPWLARVNQLLLDADSQMDDAVAAATTSLLDGLQLRDFRRWWRRSRSGKQHRFGQQLQFINCLVLPQPQKQQQHQQMKHKYQEQKDDEEVPVNAPPPTLALLPDFNLARMERQIDSVRSDEFGQEILYFQLMQQNHSVCPISHRIGRSDDGGWDVCFMEPFHIGPGCLAFSFGIDYMYEYDDILASEFQCTVRMFDPSMTNISDGRVASNRRQWFYKRGLAGRTGRQGNWEMSTLCDVLDEFSEAGQTIDILKIDVEIWEWEAFEMALVEGCLSRVKQLLFESHSRMPLTPPPTYNRFMRVWLGLLKAGFRMWKSHLNPKSYPYTMVYDKRAEASGLAGTNALCCYEHYMLNWNFVADAGVDV